MVKKIIYGSSVPTPAIEYGKQMEVVARRKFETRKNTVVKDAGLFIHRGTRYLGASPDGKYYTQISLMFVTNWKKITWLLKISEL